jgi:hypothetical protein
LQLQVYTRRVHQDKGAKEVAPWTFYDEGSRVLYQPWATDLLPHEIDQQKQKVLERKTPRKNQWIYVGTTGGGLFGNQEQIDRFRAGCQKFNLLLHRPVAVCSREENRDWVFESRLAPCLVGPWQAEHGYIPCRIFKNISYGNLGVTNSEEVYRLLDGKVIFHSDPYELVSKALSIGAEEEIQLTLDLMDTVKKKHTYLQRIEQIFSVWPTRPSDP